MTAAAAPQPQQAPPAAEPALILARVRAHAALRTAWLRRLWAAEGVPAGVIAVTHAEADAALVGSDDPDAEAAWRASPEAAPLAERAGAADAELAAADGRLARLRRTFGLDEADADLLQLAFAAAADPAVERLCAYLHDHPERAYASQTLAARIFGRPGAAPWPPDAGVLRWCLVDCRPVGAGAPDAVTCDPQIVAFLLGREAIDGALVDRLAVVPPRRPLARWPVDETAALARQVLETGAAMRVIVRGVTGEGRRTFAAAVAAELGLAAVAVRLPAEDAERDAVALRAVRQAFLDGVAPVWDGHAHAPDTCAPFPLEFVRARPERRPAARASVVDHVVDLPATTTADRERMWLEHHPGAASWGPAELDRLAGRFRAAPLEIAQAAAAAPASPDDAAQLVQRLTADRAGDLAQRLACPFEPDDLVIADRVRDVLDAIVHEGAVRTTVWEQPGARRLFPTGRALVALFAGPPGTGKTMAAQVIARELGFDLWRVDLSSLVSKYVGETAENIERLLNRAAGTDVVLLFDEADALYGKRASEVRDAQDRYVNMDTGHLMVAVENHDGVVLLATNQKGAIDPAFLRRLRYVVDFPRPDAEQRKGIWERVVRGLAGPAAVAALAADLEALAAGVDATGSQIKYAVLGGLFAARRADAALAREHLLAGLNRELTKEGRSLSDRELNRLGHR